MSVTAPMKKPTMGLFSRVADYSSKGIYRIFGAPSSVLKLGHEFRLDPRQIPLATVAATALLYSHGQELAKGPRGDRSRWLKLLTESGVIYAIMATTAGILPLFGLGTAAYRAGQKGNALDRVKEVVKTASMLFMGYIGAMTGLRYSMHAVESGAKELLPFLDDTKIWKEFDPARNPTLRRLLASSKEDEKLLGEALKRVGESRTTALDTIKKYFKFLADDALVMDGQVNQKLAHNYRKQIDQTLAKLLEDISDPKVIGRIDKKLDTLARQIAEGTAGSTAPARRAVFDRLKKFTIKLGTSHSGYVRGLRMGNPIFGALIGATLIGIPLARGINGLVEKAMPSLRKTDMKVPNSTLWFSENGRRRPSYGGVFGIDSKTDLYTRPDLNPSAFHVYKQYKDSGEYM